MVTLPLVRTLPPFRGKIEIVPLLQWLEQEYKDAAEWADSETEYQDHPESADQYAAGYRDALSNVLHHLTGMGE